ncbi:MAG: amidohydrolase family protein [Chloroflexi bacterium]|nr:amidohydrolase family protein [Chloroflexota bacterium]
MVDLVITGDRMVTPVGVRKAAVAVKNGRIVSVSDVGDSPPANSTIDATGQIVFPGIVDPEGHPGTRRPFKDSLLSETRAAAAGGVTTWGIQQASAKVRKTYVHTPRPEDIVPFSQAMPDCIGQGEDYSVIDFFFTGFITTDEQALDIPKVARDFGVTSFKYYLHMMQGPNTSSVWAGRQEAGFHGFDDGTVHLGLEKTAEIGPPGIVAIHPENWEIARIFEDRLKRSGRTDMAAWDARSPHFCEAGHARNYAYYARIAGCPIYILHTTTRETVEEIVRARAEGTKIYSQTGHHYLALPHDVWKINVPLRDSDTMAYLWTALRDGLIDCIGTDHVDIGLPKDKMDKGNVWETISGFPSRVEALVPVMMTEGVLKGRISIERMAQVCSENPARIFGVYPKKGAIAVGCDADFTIVDPQRTMTVKREMIHSSGGWSVWEGRSLSGWPVRTILRGKTISEWPEGAPRAQVIDPPYGRYIPRKVGHQLYPMDGAVEQPSPVTA